MQRLPKTVLGFYWYNIKQTPWVYFFVVLFIICASVIGQVMAPISNKLLFSLFEDNLTPDNWLSVSFPVFAIVLGLYISQWFVGFIGGYIQDKKYPVFFQARRRMLYKYVYNEDWLFFVDNNPGKIASLVGRVAELCHAVTIRPFTRIAGTVMGCVINVGLVLALNVWIGLMGLGAIILKAAWYIYWQRKLSAANKELSKKTSEFSGQCVDSIENFNAIKIFNGQKTEEHLIDKFAQETVDMEWRTTFLRRMIRLPELLMRSGLDVGIYVVLVYLFACGQISISDVTMTTAAFWTSFNRISNLAEMIPDFTSDLAKASQAYQDLTEYGQHVTDEPNARPLKIKSGAIDFDNVSFAYVNNKKILNNFNLKISGGERIGFVGLSGEGKTTLVHLLLRLFDVSSGSISIDGTDIRKCTQKSLRANISFVPQDNKLFNRSILENIRYGVPNATKAMVINAAKKANIHDFIMTTPDKYDTLVGNNGIKLSGGQRQRIAIARAILRNSPILIFDEATSSLDSKNEIAIQHSLNTLMRGRTAIVIAHRLPTLRNMDKIVVINHGRVAEIGSHNQLVKRRNGIYAKLYAQQSMRG